jgi:2-methylene-furan-3-one reductase
MAVPAVHEAWVYRELAAAKDVLKLEQIPVPPVKPTEVLIKVKAAGLNPIDGKRYQGYLGEANSPLPVRPCSAFRVSFFFYNFFNLCALYIVCR